MGGHLAAVFYADDSHNGATRRYGPIIFCAICNPFHFAMDGLMCSTAWVWDLKLRPGRT